MDEIVMGGNIVHRYWKCYGGFTAVICSAYFWGAIIMTALLFPLWISKGWWEVPLALMPNLLGFSLGGFAMWMAMGDEKFRSVISGSDNNEASPYMEVNATFVHFLVLQILSIILSLIAKAYGSYINPGDKFHLIFGEWFNVFAIGFSAICYFIFIYAIVSTLAAVFAIFRVSSWYDDFMG